MIIGKSGLETGMHWIVAGAILLAAAGQAALADDRIMPLPQAGKEPPLTYQNGDTAFRLYGQINEALLSYDDGFQSTDFGLVSNSNEVTRFGAEFVTGLGPGWRLGGVIEFGYAPYPSNQANLDNIGARDFALARGDLRYLDLILAGKTSGTFHAGQGNMASEGTTKADLSGTRLTDYSGVGETAGGQFIRTADGGFSGLTIGDAFKMYDGLGRLARLRYDSPLFGGGFVVSASYGQDRLADDDSGSYDIAATYGRSSGADEWKAALGYAWAGDDTTILSGSVSYLDKASGLSLTVAASSQDAAGADSVAGYVKAGWQADLADWGRTAFAVDRYQGGDIVMAGSRSQSWGLTAVQDIDRAGAQVYLTARNYDYDDPAGSYAGGLAVMFGAMYEF